MNESIFIIQLMFVVGAVWLGLKYADKAIEEMYKRKGRPKNTKTKCPVSNNFLKDFELVNGHCVSCVTKGKCAMKMAEDYVNGLPKDKIK